MNWFYGPTDYGLLDKYDRNLDEIVPLGWGIFGWINKFIFVPLFGLLSSFMPLGIAIILFTIIIKLRCRLLHSNRFYHQAKMKVLRPEINEINEKVKTNEGQQETMGLV